ncbi:MAG: nucleotidyltransferase family protein [Phormidesmis sp.]
MLLLDSLKEKRIESLQIASAHGACNGRVFGSVVRREETPESDIDFLIDYDADKTTPWFPGGLLMDLQDLLGRKVDILT